jgi:type III restriction enzyme
LQHIDDGRRTKLNPLNENFYKQELQARCEKINRKAAYSVRFKSDELIKKCVGYLDLKLQVKRLEYKIERGDQNVDASYEDLKRGEGFTVKERDNQKCQGSVHSA